VGTLRRQMSTIAGTTCPALDGLRLLLRRSGHCICHGALRAAGSVATATATAIAAVARAVSAATVFLALSSACATLILVPATATTVATFVFLVLPVEAFLRTPRAPTNVLIRLHMAIIAAAVLLMATPAPAMALYRPGRPHHTSSTFCSAGRPHHWTAAVAVLVHAHAHPMHLLRNSIRAPRIGTVACRSGVPAAVLVL
jgi:hypothetical protein